MIPYASYAFALSIAGVSQQTSAPVTYVPQRLIRNLRITSRRVDQEFHSRRPLFAPWKETRSFALDGYSINSQMGTFRFPDYLLALDGNVTINGTTLSSVEVYPDSSAPPFRQLRLTADCASWYTQVCQTSNTPLRVSIPGIWGFHSLYAEAWLDVDALAANITDSATTITVVDVDGEDVYGTTPRISVGHLLKIDDEYLEVTATDTDANTVTVIRGAHGSLAVAHLSEAVVSVWQVEQPVQWAVARQAGLMYARFGAYTTVETSEFSEIRYPADWLSEVYGVLNAYAYG